MEGPDQILPTDDLVTWNMEGCVKLRMTKEWPSNRDSTSLVTFVTKQCQTAGSHVAMIYNRDNQIMTCSYNQYLQDIRKAAKGFIHFGLQPLHSVSIWGFNAPEWFLSHIGAIFAGGVSVGLYPTNSMEVNKFILDDSRSNILVVEDASMVAKVIAIKNDLVHLKKIVQYTGKAYDHPDVISWAELMEVGNREDDAILKQRHKKMAINQVCCLVYTSGTVGNPKGVMLSHDNMYWTIMIAAEFIKLREYQETMISYLPLSHVAACLIDIWAMMSVKGTTYFADKMALKGTLLDTMKAARPTVFFGVPRVWEKIMEGMLEKGKSVTGLKKKISVACKKAGLDHHLKGKNDMLYSVGKKVFYKKVKEVLGLDRAVSFFTGAAPISNGTLQYFLSLDIVILDLFGMSETTGPSSMNFYGSQKLGSVGRSLPGVNMKLDKAGSDGEGEICMWGRNVMMGYLNREDRTLESIDADGWMHSGDSGRVDKDGFYFITGRLKELLITAGGENIPPVIIEEKIKSELPCLSNAVLIGDRMKFLTVFLTFRVLMDENDVPTDQLTAACQDWCRSVGCNATTVQDILSGPDPAVMTAIQAGIDRANSHANSNACKVQRWTILPHDVSIAGGELGPTLKLKRHQFNEKYAQAIERLYL